MKGVVLAGGRGSRLRPITSGISKHLLPVFDKPMIYYPLSVLMLAGLQDIMIICTPEDLAAFKRLLGDGSQFGIRITFTTQDAPRGLADAVLIAQPYCGTEGMALALGDNLFYGQGFVPLLRQQVQRAAGASIFAYPVRDPSRFGVVEVAVDENERTRAISLVEKPTTAVSPFAVTGLYFYANADQAARFARSLKPSARGELEITDLNRCYLEAGQLDVSLLGRGFAWLDTGTPESLLEAAQFVHTLETRQGLKIACLEEIALRNGWLTNEAIRHRADELGTTDYASYLRAVADGSLLPLLP